MIKDLIYADLEQALKSLKVKEPENWAVEIPSNPDFGDYSTNIAMMSAKANKKKPRDLAEKFAAWLEKSPHYSKVRVDGPGFINLTVADSIYHGELAELVDAGAEFGSSDYGQGRKVLIEFISANPTGPLNIVSARAAAFGDTLHRIMRFIGFESIREFYINDAGNQVEILAESLELRYREIHGEDIGEFPTEAYHGEYLVDLAHRLNSVEGSKLLHIAERDRLVKMMEFALKEIHEMQRASLDRFDVEFDSWISEKKLRAQGVVEEVLSFLAEANCTYESDDAVWFASSKFGDEKDRVLMKADGTITYFVPDIAYHITKYQRGFDQLIDVLGPDHHGYVPRLKAAIRALGYDESKLEIIFLQQVNLFEEGEKVMMSKRAGKIVTMDDLIDEVGKDAARFFFINRKPNSHLNFDLELATKKSSENPVYYCQYAHARIHSILKKAKTEKISLAKFDRANLALLTKDEEIGLIKKMLELPYVLNSAADNREPHRLADFTVEVAEAFHKYYQKQTIVDKKAVPLSQARLFLIDAIRNVLGVCLDLMGISAPDKM
jgi:arginyl-tRNA synthetase